MDDSGETFVCVMHIPVQLLLNPEWEAMCWDEALRQAHEAGVIPIGPIHLDTKRVPTPRAGQLTEGVPMAIGPLIGVPVVVEVTDTMMIGAQL